MDGTDNDTATDIDPATTERPVGQAASKSVLVVEDDESIRETLKMALQLEGYVVHTADNGRTALERLKEIPEPSLILLDLMMPVMSGWEFVDAIEKDDLLLRIPVVVVTAFPLEAGAIQAKAIIKKPVDLDLLYRTVRKWCTDD